MNVILPRTILNIYQRLIKAIKHMPYSGYINKNNLLSKYPQLKAHIYLIDHCLNNYPRVLSGELGFVSVLFPNGEFDLVEPIIHSNHMANYYNSIIRQIVLRYISNKKLLNIQIIEIGAGTGGTTRSILPVLKNTTYYFTDISLAYIIKAKKLFQDYPFVRYRIYNVEQRPDINIKNKFDIVIAANVLHATSDINNTIKNVHNLLKDNGVLILIEPITRLDHATITFGLTTGWWLYNDSLRISDSPFLTLNSWSALLKKTASLT
jgi:SAM-dependent methyltransferase